MENIVDKDTDTEYTVMNNLVIKNKNNDKPAIILTADDQGGEIFLYDTNGDAHMHIGFNSLNGKPMISLFDTAESGAVSISIMRDGGALQIRGTDGKAKHIMYIDGDIGKILSGNDVFEEKGE